jgi:hypothetical protein
MTLKEKLIKEIERSSDEVLEQLLQVLKTLEPKAPTSNTHDAQTSKLQQEQGILVIKTNGDSNFDVNSFINDVREKRIQDQIQLVNQ